MFVGGDVLLTSFVWILSKWYLLSLIGVCDIDKNWYFDIFCRDFVECFCAGTIVDLGWLWTADAETFHIPHFLCCGQFTAVTGLNFSIKGQYLALNWFPGSFYNLYVLFFLTSLNMLTRIYNCNCNSQLVLWYITHTPISYLWTSFKLTQIFIKLIILYLLYTQHLHLLEFGSSFICCPWNLNETLIYLNVH